MLGVFSLPEPVTFRPGFLWGSATAGHQIEGGNIHSHKYSCYGKRKRKKKGG